VATETRVFESVDSSPEAKAANAAYFAEQGITHEVKDSETGDAKPTEETTKPPATAAPATGSEPEETAVDAETAADWDSAQTDGKRKSRYAKKRQEARELKVKAEQLETKTQAQERELAELRAKLNQPTGETKPGEAPAGQPAASATAEQKFTEPEPAEPKYEDFAAEDDQLLAYQKALAKHSREWSRWDRRREKFEETAQAEQTRKTEQVKTAREQRLAQLADRLTEVRKELPDFDAVMGDGAALSRALSAASTVVPGGLKAAYLLVKDPVKLKQFNEQTADTQKVNGQDVPTQGAYDLALYLLGQAAGIAPAQSPAPAGTPPAASPSSSSQPREEQPAPAPARGRASAEPRREDLSGDARRDRLAAELGR
jgi:hypothetical protein